MADTKKSSSLEQQMAEDEISSMVEDWLGCKVSRNPKIKMNNNDECELHHSYSWSCFNTLIKYLGCNSMLTESSMKSDEIVAMVSQHGDGIRVGSSGIELGTIDINKLLYLDDKDVSELIYSFIEYALLREEVQRRKKKRKVDC